MEGAHLLHAIEGRWRIRVAAIKNDADCAAAVRDGIGAIAGVRGVVVNLVTASVTITYASRELPPSVLRERLSKVLGCPIVGRAAPPITPSADAIVRAQEKAVQAFLTKATEAAIRRAFMALM